LELRYQHPEEQAENLFKSIVDKGYLKVEKDKDGREIVLPGEASEEEIPFMYNSVK